MHHRGGVHPYRYVQGRRWRFYSSLLRTVRRRHACSRHVVPYEGTRARARARSLSPVSCFFFLRFAAAQNFPAHVWRHHIIAFANRFRSKSSRTRVCYYTYFILYTRRKKKKKKTNESKMKRWQVQKFSSSRPFNVHARLPAAAVYNNNYCYYYRFTVCTRRGLTFRGPGGFFDKTAAYCQVEVSNNTLHAAFYHYGGHLW